MNQQMEELFFVTLLSLSSRWKEMNPKINKLIKAHDDVWIREENEKPRVISKASSLRDLAGC